MKQVLLLGALDGGRLLGDARCTAVREALPDVHLIVGGRDELPADLSPSCEAMPTSAGTLEAAVRDADAVVVCGDPFEHPLLPFLARVGAQRRGTPVALLGVGAIARHGRDTTRLAARLARAADLLVLRDESSTAGLASIGVAGPYRIGADPAWATLRTNGYRDARDRARITVAVPGLCPGRQHIVDLASAIDALPDDLSVRVVNSDDDGDRERASDLVHALRRDAVIEQLGPDLAAIASALVGDRLTVTGSVAIAMASAAVGTPVLSLTADAEHIALGRRLEQLTVYPDATTAVLQHACELALTSRGPDPDAVDQEIARANHALAQVRALVDPPPFGTNGAGQPSGAQLPAGTAASRRRGPTLNA